LREYIDNRDKVESLCGFPWIKRQMQDLHLNTS